MLSKKGEGLQTKPSSKLQQPPLCLAVRVMDSKIMSKNLIILY